MNENNNGKNMENQENIDLDSLGKNFDMDSLMKNLDMDSLMKSFDMGSLMNMANNLLKDDLLKNSTKEISLNIQNPAPQLPNLNDKIENSALASISGKLENISNELSELKKELSKVKEENKYLSKLIKKLLNSNKK